jgi:hypothetical protein
MERGSLGAYLRGSFRGYVFILSGRGTVIFSGRGTVIFSRGGPLLFDIGDLTDYRQQERKGVAMSAVSLFDRPPHFWRDARGILRRIPFARIFLAAMSDAQVPLFAQPGE